MTRESLRALLIFLLAFAAPVSLFAEPTVGASSAVLMDAATGKVLYEKNAHERRDPASTTKIMTAIVALENASLDEIVTTSASAAERDAGESAIWLKEGEQLTMEQMLLALMVRSANDAASAIAEHVAGSEAAFAEMMNAKAKELGMHDTHFVNPHGFYGEGHYTTAYDLALAAAYAQQNDDFRRIATTEKVVIPWPGHDWDRVLYNRNKFLRMYPGADGVKTGFTNRAGRCFVASAVRDGWRLIAVVLNSPDMWNEAAALLEYGFTHFEPQVVVPENFLVKQLRFFLAHPREVSLITAEPVTWVGRKGEPLPRVEALFSQRQISLPMKRAELAGELEVRVEGKTLARVPVVSSRAIERDFTPLLPFGAGFFLATFWLRRRTARAATPASFGGGESHPEPKTPTREPSVGIAYGEAARAQPLVFGPAEHDA